MESFATLRDGVDVMADKERLFLMLSKMIGQKVKGNCSGIRNVLRTTDQ